MIYRATQAHERLKSTLVSTRKMMSLVDKDIATASPEMVRETENWVPMWVDEGHVVTSDCGELRAYRAIGLDGTLMWFVRHPQKLRGYHAQTDCPFDAFVQAQSAWKRRAQVRSEWAGIKAVARDLISGRIKFDVTRDDAYASPLCKAGIDGFMARLGMANVNRIGGRTAALLMKIDPQLGFVIREAHRRHMRETRATHANPIATAKFAA